MIDTVKKFAGPAVGGLVGLPFGVVGVLVGLGAGLLVAKAVTEKTAPPSDDKKSS
jgi:hypothetical protein